MQTCSSSVNLSITSDLTAPRDTCPTDQRMYRVLLRRGAATLRRANLAHEARTVRFFCTKDDDPKIDFEFISPHPRMSDPDNEVYKNVTYTADKKPIFEYNPNDEIEKNFDWTGFEKSFGLTKYHDIDFEEWKPYSVASSAEIDGTKSKSKKAAMYMAKKHMETPAEALREEEKAQQSLRQLQEIVRKAEARNASTVPVDTQTESDPTATNPSTATNVENERKVMAKATSQPSQREHVPESIPPPKYRSPKRQAPADGSTRKLERTRVAAEKSAQEQPKRVKKPTKPTVQFSDDMLLAPVNTRRPGYERRIRSLEVQMERIATEVLCVPGNEFNSSGATMRHVLLAPNGCTLLIYFEADGRTEVLKGSRFKNYKAWNKFVCGEVRSALARQLYAKRVPKVELIRVREGGAFNETDLEYDPDKSKRDLDNLFSQIAEERSEAPRDQSSKSGDMPTPASSAGIDQSHINTEYNETSGHVQNDKRRVT